MSNKNLSPKNYYRLDSEKKAIAERLVTAGHTVKEAADQTGLDYGSLRKAAYRERWAAPSRVAREIARTLPGKVTEVLVADGIDQKARYVQRMADGVADRISLAVGAMDTDTLLRRSREIETLDRVSRRTLQLDDQKPDDKNAINIMILGDPSISDSESRFYHKEQPQISINKGVQL
jgi:hypothetical protein